MRLQLKALRLVATLLSLLTLASFARADEASGTWTGEAEARGNYFYERSTRVIVPTFALHTEAPNGVRLGAEYLVDVISSASIAQTGGGSDGVFTELRHGVGLDVGKTFELGGAQLDLGINGRYSTESDYISRVYGLQSGLSWNEKTTSITLGLTRVDDTVKSSADATFEKGLDGMVVNTALTQIVSPRVTLGVGYQLGYLSGFLSNPYRRALVGPLPHAEDHPDTRLRHNIEGSLSWFLPTDSTSLVLAYRTYVDSWDIVALTPEVRIYQEVGEDFVVRARYRFYTQSRAYFFQAPRYPVGYKGPVTADPKLGEFDSHQIGLKLEYRLSFFQGSFMDFARDTWLDLSVDRQFCSSSFGNEIIATVGARLPF